MQFRREDFLILGILFSLLFPPLPEIGRLSFRLDDLLLLGVAPLYCLSLNRIRCTSTLWIFLSFLFFALISTFRGYLKLNVPPIFGDFNEFIRMFKYIFAIIIASSINATLFWKKYDKLMWCGGIYIIIISIIEYINPFNINLLIGKIYSVPYYHLDAMVSATKRIVVTGGDPNIGGFIVTYFLVYYYLKTLMHRNYRYILMTILLLLCVIATSSRTIFLATLFICGFMGVFNKNIKMKILIVILIVSGILILFSSEKFQYLTVGLKQLSTGDNVSMNIRYLIWEKNLNYFKSSMLLGWGPAKAIHDTVVDGEYVFFLVRYGIIGISIYLLLLLNNIAMNFKMNDIYSKYVLFITIISLFFMITNNFFSGYQLFLNYIILVTVVLTNRREEYISLN